MARKSTFNMDHRNVSRMVQVLLNKICVEDREKYESALNKYIYDIIVNVFSHVKYEDIDSINPFNDSELNVKLQERIEYYVNLILCSKKS